MSAINPKVLRPKNIEVICKRKLKKFGIQKGDNGVMSNTRIGLIRINDRTLCLNKRQVKNHFKQVN